MYDRITNTSIDVFDSGTGNYMGKARFELSPDSEATLLDLLNYGKTPQELVLTDVTLYEPAKSYVPPKPYEAYQRKSIINAVARDKYSGEQVPVELRLKYNSRVRAHLTGNLYYFECIDFENIEVVDVQQVRY